MKPDGNFCDGSYDPMPGNPDSLARFVESETAKWGRIIRAAGIERE